MGMLQHFFARIAKRRKVKGPFTLEPGRHIAFEGKPIAFVNRTGDSVKGWTLGPADTDDLAHEIVALLNSRARGFAKFKPGTGAWE